MNEWVEGRRSADSVEKLLFWGLLKKFQPHSALQIFSTRVDTPATLKLNHEPINCITMDEQVQFTNAPTILEISEGSEKEFFNRIGQQRTVTGDLQFERLLLFEL